MKTGLVSTFMKIPICSQRNEKIDLSDTRDEQLVRQLEAELRPVLRPADFEAFDFDRAFARVVAFAGRVS